MKLFLDTETTGLDVGVDRVCSLAMVLTTDSGGVIDVFQEKVFNPQTPLHPEAARVNGFTDEQLKDYPVFASCAKEISEFMLRDENGQRLQAGTPADKIVFPTIIAHNAKFDIDFLNYEFHCAFPAESQNFIELFPVEDTRLMAKALFGHENGFRASLNAVAERVNVDYSARAEIHSAMVDVEVMMACYFKMKALHSLK